MDDGGWPQKSTNQPGPSVDKYHTGSLAPTHRLDLASLVLVLYQGIYLVRKMRIEFQEAGE